MPTEFGSSSVFHYSLPTWHEIGDGRLETASDLDSGKLLLSGGEILVSKLNPEKNAVLTAKSHNVPTVCSPEFIALVPKKIEPRFAYYLMLSAQVRYQLNASVESVTKSHKRARVDRFLAAKLDIPELATQQQTADFLDRETARINELISKKHASINLQKEKAEALLEQTIVGESVQTSLKHHVRILPGFAFPSSEFEGVDEGIRLLKGVNVTPGRIDWSDVSFWPENKITGFEKFMLREGDVVFGMDRPWISTGVRVSELKKGDTPSLLLQRVCKITPRETLNKTYMVALLSSRSFYSYFEPLLTGVSVPHISSDQIANFKFCLKSIDEQRSLMADFTPMKQKIDLSNSKMQMSIRLLEEYRAALITAAVTGQIHVNEYRSSGAVDRHLDGLQQKHQT